MQTSTLIPAISPEGNTLDELFSRDPVELTRPEIEAIIKAFRESRAKWVLEETAAKAAGRRAKAPTPQLSLGDLDL